jgi:hypothetical protein
MKKIYSLLTGALLVASSGMFAEEIVVKNFSPDGSGVVYNQNGIKVTAANAVASGVSISAGCAGINGTTSTLYLRKDQPAKSYVDIDNDGSMLVITGIKFIGSSYTGANQSQLLLGYSVDGTTFPAAPNNLYADASTPSTALSKVVSLPADPATACSSAVAYAIPETVYQGPAAGPRTTTYPRSDVRKIRLTGNKSIHSISLGDGQDTGNNAYLYGIILTVEGTSTGIGENLEASQTPVKTVCYDLTGKAVPADSKGFVIIKTTYGDGSVACEKAYNP